MSEDTIEKTFQVTAPARLMISNIRGSITILPGSADVIQVKAVKHGSFDNGSDAIEMVQDSDSSVRVETRSREALFGFISHPPKVEYHVLVPQDIHLDASCISSSLNVSGLKGVFKLKTVSGDIELAELTGTFRINAVSGSTTGVHLDGALELEAVSGRVRLMESNFPSADASTVSGDMTLQTIISGGPYQFGSVSGDVRMLVPADTHCNAEIKSVSGGIRSSLPATTTRVGHGLKVTQIQGGGTTVRLKTVSGDLSFETEGVPATPVDTAEKTPADFIPPIPPIPAIPPIPTIPPIPPIPPTPSGPDVSQRTPPAEKLTTAEILQRIERGEMTVDEAIKLMKEE